MQCDICFRTGGAKLPFLCPTDARNVLYEPRMANARILIEKDALDRQITASTSGKQTGDSSAARQELKLSRWDVENNVAERDLAVDRTEQIMAQAEDLRSKIEGARADIARRKAIIARRKSEMESATNGLEQRRIRQIEEIEKTNRMRKYKWNQMHGTTTVSRAFLCGEAAKLYGLRYSKDNDTQLDRYSIAGVPIVDLRAMNTASPAQITTSLSHIAHLLVLATHYLAIRLPAEITLPHRDYPLPTILAVQSSHIHTNLPFPGTPFHSSSNSPSASRHIEVSNLPRPRPLFLSKMLPLLAKEDPSAHSLFLEGTTLLAYNIAWVCKSQGIPIETAGTATFEDICALGRNLFNLLIGNSPRPSPRVTPNPSIPGTPTKSRATGRDPADPSESGPENGSGRKTAKDFNASMGHFSHGTSHTFLGSPEGNDFMRSFKLPSPKNTTDKLKAHLLNEMSSAEWEVLNPDAWAEDAVKDLEDDGVMVGARRGSGTSPDSLRRGLGGAFGGAMQSFMSMKTVMDAVEIVGGGGGGGPGQGDRKQGTNGWTKLKPR